MNKQQATIEVIAPTIEEAVKNGLIDLGLNEEEHARLELACTRIQGALSLSGVARK